MGSKYTKSQMYKIGVVYDLLAQMLPTEGKDYSIKFSFDNKSDPDDISFSFKAYTELGKIWCDYCSKAIGQMGGQK